MALDTRYDRRVFVATAEALDSEMVDRIAQHRRERAGAFETIEAPLALGEAIRNAARAADVVVVDCLTVWLGNCFYRRHDIASALDELLGALDACRALATDLIMVTNEVGWGVVPDNAAARRFRDSAGRVNRAVAGRADRVVLMVSGIGVCIKGESDV
jgi:adenosylcobinamide kinase/adenosylcobinamide-phosphate guanylyltransferase